MHKRGAVRVWPAGNHRIAQNHCVGFYGLRREADLRPQRFTVPQDAQAGRHMSAGGKTQHSDAIRLGEIPRGIGADVGDRPAQILLGRGVTMGRDAVSGYKRIEA